MISRLVVTLNPLLAVVAKRIKILDPVAEIGPVYIAGGKDEACIRTGAVWGRSNQGFYVDFMRDRVKYTAWCSDRSLSFTVGGKTNEKAVDKDLKNALDLVGIRRDTPLKAHRKSATSEPEKR